MFPKISWTGILSARSLARGLCCLVAGGSIGCATGAGLQDTQYCLTQKARAEISWLTCNDFKQRWDLGSDYAHGYKKGYYDAATGRGCKLPAVPPPCYWSAKYQDCEGQEAIAAWYRGYQCGAAAAESKGYPSFHDVPVGPCAPSVNMTGCQGCYAPDNCACGANVDAPLQAAWSEPTTQFHAGLFGQYGSALSPAPGNTNLTAPVDQSIAPPAPEAGRGPAAPDNPVSKGAAEDNSKATDAPAPDAPAPDESSASDAKPEPVTAKEDN